MHRLRTTCFIVASVLCFATVASAQDFDRRIDESHGQLGWQGATPWAGNEQIASDAHRLSQQASTLARRLQRNARYSYLGQSAIQLANAAEQFHQTVESSAPPQQVMQAFVNLQQQYYDTRTAFFRANRSADLNRLSDEWTQLAASHERLALSMGVEESQYCTGQQGPGGPTYGRVNPGYQYGQRFG